jgi:hypothetical protein
MERPTKTSLSLHLRASYLLSVGIFGEVRFFLMHFFNLIILFPAFELMEWVKTISRTKMT